MPVPIRKQYFKMNNYFKILEKIKHKKARIGVIGQGYVGLPLSVCFAKNGFSVTGLDVDKKKVQAINRGENYLPEMGIDRDLKKAVRQGRLRASSEIILEVKGQDVIIICVPTPVDKKKKPDISLLKKASSDIGLAEPKGKLIVNESTVAPLTTLSIVGKIITQKSRLKPGVDFFLACSPERINPGDSEHRLENTPKVVAGLGLRDLQLVKTLYKQVIKAPLVTVGSLAAAETVKMLENSYRAVNIALINELAKFCQKINIDVLEIIEAAKSKWTFQAHWPGVGVGGHCIPVDPYYLLAEAKRHGVKMPVLEKAMAENESMPRFVLDQILLVYQPGQKVLVYGLAYKRGVKDIRESPALELCRLMKKKQINFAVYDPYFRAAEVKNLGFEPGKLEAVDILVVATDHSQLKEDAKKLISKKTIIIDGRNFFKEKVGSKVIGVGRRLE